MNKKELIEWLKKDPSIPIYEDLNKLDQAIARLTDDPIWLEYKDHIKEMKSTEFEEWV